MPKLNLTSGKIMYKPHPIMAHVLDPYLETYKKRNHDYSIDVKKTDIGDVSYTITWPDHITQSKKVAELPVAVRDMIETHPHVNEFTVEIGDGREDLAYKFPKYVIGKVDQKLLFIKKSAL